jgi:serine protease Do
VFRFEESLPRTFVQPPRIDVETPLLRFLPRGWLDMELVTLNEELGSYFGTTQGVLVVRAPEETSLNLRSGDVILDIDGREPSSPSHALRIMRSYEPGETMRIEVMRDKRRQTITATVPERDGGFFWR